MKIQTLKIFYPKRYNNNRILTLNFSKLIKHRYRSDVFSIDIDIANNKVNKTYIINRSNAFIMKHYYPSRYRLI